MPSRSWVAPHYPMLNDHIVKLTEMGFSVEQANEALRVTDNDLAKAVDYLFGDPIEVPPADTVQVSNPEQIPDFQEYSHTTSYAPPELPRRPETPEAVTQTYEEEDLELLRAPRSELPPALLVPRLQYLENYVVPVLAVLAQLQQFREVVFESIDSEDTEVIQFFREVQHALHYFLHRSTNRNFIVVDKLLKLLPGDLKTDLSLGVESVEDVVLKIFESLTNNYDRVYGDKRVEKLLHSLVESLADDVRSGVYVLEIELESRNLTLYSTLNELFWQRDFRNLGLIKYDRLAPVLTFHLVSESDSEYEVRPFRIDEEIYPQLYTDECVGAILEMRSREITYDEERKRVTNNLLHLNFFEGKKVELFLSHAVRYLEQKEVDEGGELQRIKEVVGNDRSHNTARQEELRRLMSELDVRNPDNVLTYIRHNHPEIQLQPYRLLGIILSDSKYFYRYAEDNEWYYFEARALPYSRSTVGFDVEHIELFAQIQEVIFSFTTSSTNGLTLIYSNDPPTASREATPLVVPSVPYLVERFEAEEAAQAQQTTETASGDLIEL